MDDGARGWLNRTARSNHWRVSRYMELDDLIQEGYYCYYYVRNRYPQATDLPHIMQLFKLTYTCHIHDLAKGTRAVGVGGWIVHTDTVPWLSGEPEELGGYSSVAEMDITEAITEAPPIIAKLLRALIAHGERLREPFERRSDGTRETLNERLCSFIGLDPRELDLHSMLLNYLRASCAG